MLKKFILLALVTVGSLNLLHAGCVEVSISTCVGDFANGGEYETTNRLLGNASFYSLGLIQGNYPRIYIASGIRTGGYDAFIATPARAGYVGIWTDGLTQFPGYHLDVWGLFRSTDSAYLATSQGGVGVGVSTASSKLDISGGSVTVRGPGAGLIVIGSGTFVGTVTSTSGFVGDGSRLTNLSGSAFSEGAVLTIASMTAHGTFTSTSGFVGDGSRLTNLSPSAIPSGSTVYANREDVINSTQSIFTGGATTYAPALAVALSTANFPTILTGGVTSYAPAFATAESTKSIFTGSATTYAQAVATALSTAAILTGAVTSYAPALAVALSTADANTRISALESAGASKRTFDIVIGTLGAPGVDIASNTEDGLIEAVNRLTGSGSSVNGYGSILFRSGIYLIKNATIPAGVIVYAAEGASVVWNSGATNQPVVTNYGILQGITIDFSNTVFTTGMIRMKSNSQFKDGVILNGFNMSNAGYAACFEVLNSTNVLVKNVLVNGAKTTNPQSYIGAGFFSVRNSTDVWFKDVKVMDLTFVAAESLISTYGSKNVHFENCLFNEAGGRFVYIGSDSKQIYFEKNKFNISNAIHVQGVFTINPVTGTVVTQIPIGISTGVFIIGNTFEVQAALDNTIICIKGCGNDGNPSMTVEHTVIMNNFVLSDVANTVTFVNASNSYAKNTIIKDNLVQGINSFISDTGTGTSYVGLGNFFNGVEQ